MPRFVLLTLTLLVACEPVPSTRSDALMPPTEPLTRPADAAAAALEVPADDQPESDEVAPADDAATETPPPTDAAAERELSDAELLAAAAGIELPPDPEPEPGLVQQPAPEDALALPARDLQAARGWGVRLVSTIPRSQPPRAVLALSSGAEVVVEPGSFVEEERLLVMAVGTDGIQIAHVQPHGDHVRIQTETLAPLYRQSTPAPLPPMGTPPAGDPLVPVE